MGRVRVLLTVLVAMLGGAVGAVGQDYGMLDGPEQEAMFDTFQYALESNATNHAAEWVNPDSGTAGVVVPVRTFNSPQGQPCREFITTIVIGGREEQGYGTACRQPDGAWQVVATERPTATAPPTAIVYPPPAHYYFYPYGFYSPYRIFLSFDFVFRGGHLYRGSYYLDGRSFRHRHPLHIRERVFVGPRLWNHYRGYHERKHRDRHDNGYRFDRRERFEQRDRGKYGKRPEDRRKIWANPDRGRDQRLRKR